MSRHIRPSVCCCLLVVAVAAPAPAGEKTTGLHISGSNVSGTTHMNAKGFTWDIRTDHGSVNHGTNYLYSNGKYLYVQGNNFHHGGRARRGRTGDEIESGPWNRNGLRIYRRVKVFKDDGVARWLDIYENPGSNDVTVDVRLQSHINYGIQNLHTSSGDGVWDEEDFAAVIDVQRSNNTPSVLHVMCGPKSKLRPAVQQHRNNVIRTNYRLTVPAGETAIIAHFAVQNHSTSDLRKMMKDFKPTAYLGDLKSAVRKMIVNVRFGGLDFIDLNRSGKADLVMLRSGDPVFGKVTNAEFVIDSAFGPLTLPADRLVGMATRPNVRGVFQAVLADGQLVCGTLAEQTVELTVPAAGKQSIPFGDIQQWSFQITSKRPEEIPFNGPQLVMRTGDRLAFDPDSLDLQLRTRSGAIPLDAEALLSIDLDNPAQAIHRVKFLNGSILAGIVEPPSFDVELTLNTERTLQRNNVARILYATEESRPRPLTRIDLNNGDQLYGRLAEESLQIKGKYGPVTVKPANMLSLQTVPTQSGWIRLTMWNGSVLLGGLDQETLEFVIEPGPTISIDAAQLIAVARPDAMPPEDIRKKVDGLIGRLAAESFEDRQKAQKELVDMGPSILPLLKDNLGSNDPEVRRRLEEIVESLSPAGGAVDNSNPGAPPPQILNLRG
ncbi:MAG: hypothetical protein GVY16_03230 [Planctomycetes bacterium]|nr:hypothetical protein [Planctomycetota bacterium]